MCVSHALLSRVKEGKSCFFNEKNEQNFAKFLLEFFKNKKKEERKKCTIDELDEMHRRLLMFRTTTR